MNESINCPICGSTARLHFKQTKDYQYSTNYQTDYYKCSSVNCLHLFSHNTEIQNISDLYTEYTTHTISRKNILSQMIALYVYIIESIFSFTKINREKKSLLPMAFNKSSTLLDYGCGSGEFLWNLSQSQWTNISGFDFDLKALEAAKSRGLNCLLTNDLSLLQSYDIITLNHVIEHIPDVNSLFHNLSKMKKNNGVIILKTPNCSCINASIFGKFWRGLESPRHFHLFTPESLVILIKKHNFNVVQIKTGNRILFGSFLESWIIACSHFNLSAKIAKIFALLTYPFLVITHSIISFINPFRNEEIILVVT